MDKATDPVCGMEVYPTPALRVTHDSQEYFFCSAECKVKFEANPGQFVPEKHDPPYTVSGKAASPRFGSAGSGGLENEPTPERHGTR